MSVSGAVWWAGHRVATLGMDDTDSFINTVPDFGGIEYNHHLSGDKYIDMDASTLQLALHIGDGLEAIMPMIYRIVMEFLWGAYTACVRIVAWFADLALGMGILQVVRPPLESIQTAIQNILRTFPIYSLMLVISAFVCVIWMARGRWGQGLVELLLALVIVNYAVASIGGTSGDLNSGVPKYSPIAIMLGGGGNEGLMPGSVNLARCLLKDIKAEVDKSKPPGISPNSAPAATQDADAGNEQTDAEAQVQDDKVSCVGVRPSESIVDTFMWFPLQMVNFGEVLSDKCQDAYAITLRTIQDRKNHTELKIRLAARGLDKDLDGKKGPLGNPVDGVGGGDEDTAQYLDEAWKVPGACQHDKADYYANQATYQGVLTQFFLCFTMAFLAPVILLIAFVVTLAGLNAVLQCLKLLISLLTSILPGGARRSLYMTIGTWVASLGLVIFGIIFLHLLLIILNYAYTANSGGGLWSRIGALLLVDLLLGGAGFMFWRGRSAVESTKDKIADALGKLSPQGGGGGGGAAFGGGAMGGAAGAFAMSKMMGAGVGAGERLRGVNAGSVDHAEHLGRIYDDKMGTSDYFKTMHRGRYDKINRKVNRAKGKTGRALRFGGRLAKGIVGKAAFGFMTGGASLLVQGGLGAIRSRAGKAIGRAVANKTFGRKSKFGNFARRGVMGARNKVANFGARTVGEYRQSRSNDRLVRQRGKLDEIKRTDPSLSTKKGQRAGERYRLAREDDQNVRTQRAEMDRERQQTQQTEMDALHGAYRNRHSGVRSDADMNAFKEKAKARREKAENR